jgi:hypothetical protein
VRVAVGWYSVIVRFVGASSTRHPDPEMVP